MRACGRTTSVAQQRWSSVLVCVRAHLRVLVQMPGRAGAVRHAVAESKLDEPWPGGNSLRFMTGARACVTACSALRVCVCVLVRMCMCAGVSVCCVRMRGGCQFLHALFCESIAWCAAQSMSNLLRFLPTLTLCAACARCRRHICIVSDSGRHEPSPYAHPPWFNSHCRCSQSIKQAMALRQHPPMKGVRGER